MSSPMSAQPDPAPIAAPTSRRDLLGALIATPLATTPLALPALVAPDVARRASPGDMADTPVILRRTRAGRDLSRMRYRNAEGFFAGIAAGRLRERADLFYHTGIVIQLGLSAHLLDVGLDDAWCARHIGLHLDRALALANATGLGLDAPPIAGLVAFLSPYGQWRHADLRSTPPACPCAPDELRAITRHLLDHVRAVTGHRRPRHDRA